MSNDKQIGIRRPKIDVAFMTEKDVFNLQYDPTSVGSDPILNAINKLEENKFRAKGDSDSQGKRITDAILNIATENDMSKDAGTFSITLVGTMKWDLALGANDVVVIKINPADHVQNDVVMVGLIGEVKKIGEYSSNSSVYAITGMSMGKALMQMKLGTLQEIAAITQAGWLYTLKDKEANESGKSGGLELSGATASGVVNQIISFFLLGFGEYTFGEGKGGRKLKDFILTNLSSRADEKLVDPTPYMSFQGSLRQFITQTQAKPFNEFYSEYTDDGKCEFIMRPTPFEKETWTALPVKTIAGNHIIEQEISKSDTDAYSIFNCAVPVDLFGSSPSYISKPQYSKDLVDKYGYSVLEEENRYIYRTKEGTNSGGTGGDASGESASLDSSGTSPVSSADVESLRRADISYADRNVITGKQIDDYVKSRRPDSIFKGYGDAFITAGVQSGLTPVYIFAHACLESNWGNNSMSNNFFGIGAFDNNPTNGHKYGNDSVADGIINGAVWISKNYYKKGQKSVYSMRWNNGSHQYATDPLWDTKIAQQMASIYKAIGYKFNTPKGDKVSKAVEVVLPSEKMPTLQDNTVEGEKEKKDTPTEKKKKEKAKEEKADEATRTNQERLGLYSQYLFNWYADNPQYYSGSIRVLGHPDYRVGSVLRVADPSSAYVWEYYLESVSQDFSFTEGYTTVLGVTRGLKNTEDRFKHHYTSEQFKGGIFGEAMLADAYEEGMKSEGGLNNVGEGGGDYGGVSDEGKIYKVAYDNDYIATVYTASGGAKTASGTVASINRTIAVDPTVIPLGSVVALKVKGRPELTHLWLAEDTGGKVKGKHIDIYVSSEYLKKNTFRTKIGVAVLKKGTGASSALANAKRLDDIIDNLDKKLLEQASSGGGKVADFAEKWRKPNKPSVYKWGGGHGDSSSPFQRGGTLRLDCSGFTGWMLYELKAKGWSAGLASGTTASMQGTSLSNTFKTIHQPTGKGASKAEKHRILAGAKAGDFIFFVYSGSHIAHVGIFMGKNANGYYFISCAGDPGTPASGIRIDSLNSGFWLNAFNGLVRRPLF